MTTNNGGAPADGGNEPIESGNEGLGAEGVGLDEVGQSRDEDGQRRQLTAEEYETRDRQKTEALRRERQNARQYRQEMDKFRSELAELRNAGRGAGPDGEDIDIPDPSQDPMAALQALRKLAGNFTQQQRQTSEQTAAQQREAQFVSKLVEDVQEAEADFRLDQPDYDDAVTHLKTFLKDELEDRGYKGPALATALTRELIRIAHEARKNQQDPAEAYWKLSLRRGFRAKNGDRQIDVIKRGQENTANIPRGGGKNSNFSREALLKADGKSGDFDKLWKAYEQQATGGRG